MPVLRGDACSGTAHELFVTPLRNVLLLPCVRAGTSLITSSQAQSRTCSARSQTFMLCARPCAGRIRLREHRTACHATTAAMLAPALLVHCAMMSDTRHLPTQGLKQQPAHGRNPGLAWLAFKPSVSVRAYAMAVCACESAGRHFSLPAVPMRASCAACSCNIAHGLLPSRMVGAMQVPCQQQAHGHDPGLARFAHKP
jgi:hypothetical protein